MKILSDEAIGEYANETSKELENSSWQIPLLIGARWSRDVLLCEIEKRLQKILDSPEGDERDEMIKNLLIGIK